MEFDTLFVLLIRHSKDARPFKTSLPEAEGIGLVSDERLRAFVEEISVPRSYYAEREANERVARQIAEHLAGFGLDVELQGPYSNVVARTPESGRRPAVLVGAHYDSVPGTPGADDNASAVAALLASAELLATSSLPLLFVAWNAEEDGMLGSVDFVDRFLPRSGLRLRVAHVLEMVGFCDPRPGTQDVPPSLPISLPSTGDFLGLVANRRSGRTAREVLSLARTYLDQMPVLALEVFLGLERFFPVLLRSDHASFWRRRIPSLLWTDTSEFRNPHYHRASDLPKTLDHAYLKRVTQLLVLATAAAARK